MKAIEGGFSEIANMLVTAQKDLKAVDHDGNTCLHYASIYGLADVTKSILNKMPVNSVNVANKVVFKKKNFYFIIEFTYNILNFQSHLNFY